MYIVKKIISLLLCLTTVFSLLLVAAPVAQAAPVWTDVCEYVATTTGLNARTGPGTSYNKLTTVSAGHQVLRLAKGSNSWSKVVVNGRIAYMHSEYLKAATYNAARDESDTNVYSNVNFTRVNESVKTNTDVNIRKGPDTYYGIVQAVGANTTVVRIGIGSNGWSQVIYKDKVAYIESDYLQGGGTTQAPPAPPTQETTPATPSSNAATYKVTTGVNVRKSTSTSSAKLGTLPKGTIVTSLEKVGQWHKINYNGKTAYIHDSCVKKVADATPINPTPTPPEKETAPTTPPQNVGYYKTTTAVNVRKSTSTSSAKLGTLPKGTTVPSLENVGQWHKINYNGTIAYIHNSCTQKVSAPNPKPSTEETTPTPPVEETVTVYYTTTGLNVRTGPSTSYAKLGTLSAGEKVESYGKTGSWHKIKYNGKTGYVHGDYLTTKKPQQTSGYPKTYQDSTCTITVYKEWYENAYVYAAHIVYTDYDRLWVECGKGKYNSGNETTSTAAKRVGAILAINGDYATPGNGASSYAIARNGKVCNNKKTYAEGVYNSNTGMLLYGQSKGIGGQMLSDLVAAGKVTDTFQFGPCVLLDGKVQGDKNSTSRAQRTFIGTNGNPGDIWLCVSDGRNNDGKSAGLNGYQCGAYLKSKGCILGVPLDGGGSSTMYFNGQVLNAAKNSQRAVPDFVMFK